MKGLPYTSPLSCKHYGMPKMAIGTWLMILCRTPPARKPLGCMVGSIGKKVTFGMLTIGTGGQEKLDPAILMLLGKRWLWNFYPLDMKKFLGILIGMMGIGLATIHFVYTWKSGEAKWQYPVLAFGMAFILYYSIVRPKRRD